MLNEVVIRIVGKVKQHVRELVIVGQIRIISVAIQVLHSISSYIKKPTETAKRTMIMSKNHSSINCGLIQRKV